MSRGGGSSGGRISSTSLNAGMSFFPLQPEVRIGAAGKKDPQSTREWQSEEGGGSSRKEARADKPDSLEKEPARRATPWRMLEHPWIVEMKGKRVNMQHFLAKVWGWKE